jgi:hypothetical protein
MKTQTEAQRLATLLEQDPSEWGGLSMVAWPAAAELRRLEAEVQALRGAVPAGWRLAPLNPTPEMKKAGGIACGFGQDIAHHTYAAMLAAAPQPAQGEKK